MQAKPFFHHALRALGLALLISFALATGPALAADVEMVGKWKLSLERSDERQQGRPLVDAEMTVKLVGEDLRVTRTYAGGMSFTATYTTDGKPHDIETPLGTQAVRAKWKKEKLTMSYSIHRQTPRGAFDLDVVETWSVDDGELVISYATRIGERPMIRREVYLEASSEK